MQTAAASYPWAKELEKTVVHSLVTTFGLDFVLFKDKDGGSVDTIHNARQGIHATDKERQRYAQRGDYDSDAYHKDPNYIATGKRDKALQEQGRLHDAYSNQTMKVNEERNLDHIIAAKEIHDDAGRVLAECDGVALANQSSNLQTTRETINKSKGQTSVTRYLERLPNRIATYEKTLAGQQKRLESLPRDTPEQKQNARKLEDSIHNTQEKIKNLKSIDPAAMAEKDKKAREDYDGKINDAYYRGSKFMKAAAGQAAVSGLNMGTREMLGLVIAEIWLELREQIPRIIGDLKLKFSFEQFMARIRNALRGIWRRVKKRFRDFLTAFKDGVFAGVMSGVTTTVFNIFATTKKSAIKIIRESWGQLVKALKLMFFNPEKLGPPALCQALAGIVSTAAGVIAGSMVHAQLEPVKFFPYGEELRTFCGALVTGLITLGLTYVLLHSEFSKKAWAYFESIMPHAGEVRKYEAINAELDRYLIELARLEFNMDPEALAVFSRDLAACNDEMQCSLVLQDEISRREIELPYEIGNAASTRQWLTSLAK